MKQDDGQAEASFGEAVFNCLGLGASGAMVGGAVAGVALSRELRGVCFALGAAVPGALLGAALGAPVAWALSRRIGWLLAAAGGLLGGAGLTWWLLTGLQGLNA